MPTTQSEADKKRTHPRDPGGAKGDAEPQVPDLDPAELENDQADSGPDRDRADL